MNNIANKLISHEEVNKIINSHLVDNTIHVNDIDIFHQAFVHKSFMIRDNFIDDEDNNCAFYMERTSSNERLEFLGDSVLNMVTAEYLFQLFPNKDEGFLTKLRTKLVRNTQLSHIGCNLGFKEWLLISAHIEKINGRENPRLIEDVFESFIASLYKDQGFYITREFIFTCFDKYVDINFLISNNDNFKDMLLRYFQLNVWSHPVYNTFLTEGVSSNRLFTTSVLLKKEACLESPNLHSIIKVDENLRRQYNVQFDDQYMMGVGTGKTKKESEQNASKTTLELLGVPNNF